MGEITLKEMCDVTGLTRRIIQGYEKFGLVAPIGKNKYGHLIYDEDCRKRVETIKFYQELEFSLKEIQVIIDAPNNVLKQALIEHITILQQENKHREAIINQAKQIIAKL